MPENRWKGAGAATTDWRTAANWNPAVAPFPHIPTDDEDVVIVNGNVDLKGGLGEALTLKLDPGLTLNVTVGNQLGNLAVSGNVFNFGTIKLNGGTTTATLTFDMATNWGAATLLERGTIQLSDSDKNAIISGVRGVTLTNANNTIIGAGEFGKGTAINFTNAVEGKVIQTGANKLSFYLGSLQGGVHNRGLMEAQGTGGLEFYRTQVDNAGGVIQAMTAGSHVDIANSTITGGLLRTSNVGGLIQTKGNSNLIDSVTSQAHILVGPNTTLAIQNNIQNIGTIEVSAQGQQARIQVNGPDTRLTGVGFLTLTDDDGNIVYGSGQNATLTNFGHVISGAGSIGHGNLTIHNYGVITATGILNELQFRSVNPSTNHGILSATGPAGLVIANTTVNSAGGGQIMANAPGAHVDLQAARLQGGTLRTTGAGAVIETVIRNNQLDGTINAVTNAGLVRVNDRTSLELAGTIKNDGTIEVAGGNNQTDLQVGHNGTKLSSGGAIKFSNSSHNNFAGLSSGSKLTNENNTISGAADFTHMTLVNGAAGLISAIYDNNEITLNTGKTITNNGALAANGGHLIVRDPVIGTGQALIIGDGVLETRSGFAQGILFQGGGGLLELGAAYGGKISGFSPSDQIDLDFLSYSPGYRAIWHESSQTLTIVDGGSTTRATLHFTGLGSEAGFKLGHDGEGKLAIKLVANAVSGTSHSDKLKGSSSSDTLTGGPGNDTLTGGLGHDRLNGGSGNDILIGGQGRDLLSGGPGGDHFVFNSVKDSRVSPNRDRILDFSHGSHDKIDLRAIDANTHASKNQAFHFIGSADFHSSGNHHVYGELRYEAHLLHGDVNGDGLADFEVRVNVSSLAKADFVL